MEPRILRDRKWDARTRASWLDKGSLPVEQGEEAARRLGLLGLIMAVVFSLFFVLFSRNVRALPESALVRNMPFFPIAGVSFAILASLVVFALSRKKTAPSRMLNIGITYEIVIAATVGLLTHIGPWELNTRTRGWSGVAVWIIVYSVIVHNKPARTLLASSAAALMDPLGLGLSLALGNPVPPLSVLPKIFVPTVVSVVIAVVASRINFRMGKQIEQAREMGSYQLVSQLGHGGMGEVWRAEHKILARPAAIKLIRPEVLGAGSEEMLLRRFEREARATSLLDSEHTIRLYDFGLAGDGSFYYAMELLDGMDLRALVDQHGPLPPERVVFLLVQICDSLAEAHEAGMIHRDIKPANIYVCRRGVKYDHVKVLDFGLVAEVTLPAAAGSAESGLTIDGEICGTPAFMAPELIASSKNTDARADIYAVGCVAYWLLTGEFVFARQTPMLVLAAHLNEDPAPPSQLGKQSVPPALDELILSCLKKDPSERPQTAQELAEKLDAVVLEQRWDQERARQWWSKHATTVASADAFAPTLAGTSKLKQQR